MYDLSNLDQKDLLVLKKKLKLLAWLRKNLGKRALGAFHRIETGASHFQVEYFPALGLEGAKALASDWFQKFFDLDVSNVEIEYKANPSLAGGLRILKDDFMVDVSYARVMDVLKKN